MSETRPSRRAVFQLGLDALLARARRREAEWLDLFEFLSAYAEDYDSLTEAERADLRDWADESYERFTESMTEAEDK